MLTKLILLTSESFEKITNNKTTHAPIDESQDWYDIRQNMQRYLALRQQKEREASEQRKYLKNIPETTEMNIQTDPIVTKKVTKTIPRRVNKRKKTLNREVQTDNLLTLPPGIKRTKKRKFLEEAVSDNSFSEDDEDDLNPKSDLNHQMNMEKKNLLRQAPKRRRLYQDNEEDSKPKRKLNSSTNMERKRSLRQAPKKRALYQHGKNFNVLSNWHCF